MSEDTMPLLADEVPYCASGESVPCTNPPKLFTGCEGSYVYDAGATPFLDLQMGHSAAHFGYRNQRLEDALRRQLETLAQVGSQHLHPGKIELARLIAQDAQHKWGVSGHVHFNVGSAQAINDSLRIVRKANHSKRLMLAFEGGDRKGVTAEEHADRVVGEFARHLENGSHATSEPERAPYDYAAICLEPLLGAGGYVIPPENFFTGIKQVLDEHGILLVVDETRMGCWRTGTLWAVEHVGITPDVLVFGNALTNGLYPLAGVWAREGLIDCDAFPADTTHANCAAHPLGTAVGLEVMKMTHELDFGLQVREAGDYFLEGLREWQRRHPEVGDVGGMGLALHAEICEADGCTPNPALAQRMVQSGLAGDLNHGGSRRGLVLDVAGHHRNVLTFAPALTIRRHEIDEAMSLLDQLITRARTV